MLSPFVLSVAAGGLFVFIIYYGWKTMAWTVSLLTRIFPAKYHPAQDPEDDHIQILVVGDIGRSPRMQYHAISIMKHGRKVDIVGFKETARHPDLIGNPRVTVYPLSPIPEWIAWGTLPFFINIPSKVIQQFWTLLVTLMYTAPAAKWIIIQVSPRMRKKGPKPKPFQNPPSIPTFHVALFVAFVRGSKVVVDWHNFGYSILAQNKWLRPLVPFYRWYEISIGKHLGDANLAVTEAMTRELEGPRFGLKSPIYTLHDRPAAIFQPITSERDREQVLMRIPETRDQTKNIMDGSVRLIVSSTSWTADEDFGMLLDALMAYATPGPASDSAQPQAPSMPILAIITGKGPQKKAYVEKIKELQDSGRLPGIRVITAWLSNRDYAALLAASDLGISLHMSSSGVDLPMKVVDMFGAGLPVAAYSKFESFSELVKEGQNGCGFETSAELTTILTRLLGDDGAEELAKLKQGAIQEGSLRWDEEWNRVVAPVIGIA